MGGREALICCGNEIEAPICEQRLWAAVLAQALEDWWGDRIRAKRDAEMFLFEDQKDFETVCAGAGIDPSSFRSRLRRFRGLETAPQQASWLRSTGLKSRPILTFYATRYADNVSLPFRVESLLLFLDPRSSSRVQKSAGDVKPEVQILLCCARKALDATQLAQLSQVPRDRINWPFLVQLANDNGLLPLLCEHLPKTSCPVPAETLGHFRDAQRQTALRALFLTAELLRITEALRRSGIPALSYKGPVLGQLAYANPLLRQFDDLDIVVPQRFMAKVYDEMGALGYGAKFSRTRFLSAGEKDIPGEYVFLHRVNGAMVELHTEATLRHFPSPPDLDGMLPRSITISLNGREVPTFSLPDTLFMLCVHGAKDFWSRLIWVADIAAVVKGFSDEDWKLLFNEAKKSDAERMVRLGLWLARSIFTCELPVRMLQDVQGDRVAMQIGSQLREQLLDHRELPEGVIWRSLYRIKMAPQIWKGIRYWIRLSTVPAEEDWAKGRPGLPGTYAILRPLRLWRKYRQSDESQELSAKKN